MQHALLILLFALSIFTTVACGDDDSNGTSGAFGTEKTESKEKGGTPSGETNTPSTSPKLPSAPKQQTPQTRQQDKGDMIVAWRPSDNYEPVSDLLQSTGIFDALAEFMNKSLILPNDIGVFHDECGIENAFYLPKYKSVVMCYEMFFHVYTTFKSAGLSDEVAGRATLNTWVFIFLHEFGHALIDNYKLPITGREEDAVDDFSTLLLIQLGLGDSAIDAAFYWQISDSGMHSKGAYAGEHSLNPQRLYNMLCTVYGSDTVKYQSIIDIYPEMEARSQRCQGEFQQKTQSWDTLLDPWIKR